MATKQFVTPQGHFPTPHSKGVVWSRVQYAVWGALTDPRMGAWDGV